MRPARARARGARVCVCICVVGGEEGKRFPVGLTVSYEQQRCWVVERPAQDGGVVDVWRHRGRGAKVWMGGWDGC